jgi:3-phenylpropionate/trans-cinnamate dioxygenase ferredoxin subunit
MSEFVRACAASDVPEQGTFAVELNGTPLVIVRSEGQLYALDEFCTHEDVSLADGEVYDQTVECWLHGSCFDLGTGKPTGPPATRALNTYQVRIDGDDVLVALPA